MATPERTREAAAHRSDPEPAGTPSRIALEIKLEIFSDHVLMVASGLAFHAMLVVLPTLAAIAAVWQMMADPKLRGSAR